jgi:hypothetical protein
MASTHNKNSKNNYNIEKNRNIRHCDYKLYENSSYGKATNTYLPDFGLKPGQLPREELHHDPINVESDLFGIGSTNLENPKTMTNPEKIHLQNINFFDRPNVILPEPLVMEKNQRITMLK